MSLLPRISKILIKIVYKQILNTTNQYLENNQLNLGNETEQRIAILRLRILIEKQISRTKVTFT